MILIITRANYPSIHNTTDNHELDIFIKQQAHLWDRTTTLQTDCIADQIAMTDLNFYRTRELKQLVNGKLEYKEFCTSVVTRFVKKYYTLFNSPEWNKKAQKLEGHSLSGAMLDLYDWYKEQGFNSEDSIDKLVSVMFPNLSNDKVHLWAMLRYNSRKKILDKLMYTIKYYYSYLHITGNEALHIISQIKHDKFAELRNVFNVANMSLYSNGRCVWNGNRVGLGNVIFSLSVKKSSLYSRNLQGWRDGLLDFTFNDSMFYYITKYDITIVTHGDDMVVTHNDWHILPVKSPYDGVTYHSISKLLLGLIDTAKVTRINVLSCNPNKVKVYPELYKNKSTLINIHEGNVIIG